jgi:hypothetical protein
MLCSITVGLTHTALRQHHIAGGVLVSCLLLFLVPVIGHGNEIRYSYEFISYISYYVNSYKARLAKARRWSKR